MSYRRPHFIHGMLIYCLSEEAKTAFSEISRKKPLTTEVNVLNLWLYKTYSSAMAIFARPCALY